MDHMNRPATKSAVSPPWLAANRQADASAAQADGRGALVPQRNQAHPARSTYAMLLRALQQDLARGYKLAAVRRILMLRALGVDVPESLRQECEAVVQCCPARVLAQSMRATNDWLETVRAGFDPVVLEKA